MTDRDKELEKGLILRAKEGDNSAFEEIIKLYEQKVCSTIYYMVKDQNVVEDIAQDVFIKIYRNISKFNEQSSLYTWIYRITMNCCFDELKRDKKVTVFSNYIENDDGDEEEVQFEDPSQNVSKIIESKLDKEELVKAIKRLPDDQRAIIVLRDIRGFTYWEIADMLKLKLGTVKSKINRARIALKEELEKAGFEYYISDNDKII